MGIEGAGLDRGIIKTNAGLTKPWLARSRGLERVFSIRAILWGRKGAGPYCPLHSVTGCGSVSEGQRQGILSLQLRHTLRGWWLTPSADLILHWLASSKSFLKGESAVHPLISLSVHSLIIMLTLLHLLTCCIFPGKPWFFWGKIFILEIIVSSGQSQCLCVTRDCWTREIHWFIPQNLLGKKLYTSQSTRGGIRSCDDMFCMTSTIMRLMVRKDNKNLKKLWYRFWSWILILFMPRSSYKTSDKFFSLTLSFLISSIRIIRLHVYSEN